MWPVGRRADGSTFLPSCIARMALHNASSIFSVMPDIRLLGRVAVAGMAAERGRGPPLSTASTRHDSPGRQWSMAPTRYAGRRRSGSSSLGDFVFHVHAPGRKTGACPRHAHEQRRDLHQRHAVIDRTWRAALSRHRRKHRVRRILNHRRAAKLLIGQQSGGAVVEIAGQDDADCGRTIDLCRRSKQRIDRGPEIGFPWGRASGARGRAQSAGECPAAADRSGRRRVGRHCERAPRSAARNGR